MAFWRYVRQMYTIRVHAWLGASYARLVIGLVLVLLLQSCTSSPALTSQPSVSTEPAVTPRPTQTPTPTALPTPTPPAELDIVLDQLDTRVAVSSPLTITNAISASVQMSAGRAISATAPVTADATISQGELVTLTMPITGSVAVTATLAAPTSPLATPGRGLAGLVPTPTPRPAQELHAAAPTPDGTVRTANVPILMYHYLSIPPTDADIYRQDLSVAPDLFAAQLDALMAAGYNTISLYALQDHLMLGTPLPPNPVVITFDDGYRDNYENALPLLADRDLTATFFVVTDFMDEERPNYLTWEMARAMQDAGMDIESHGRNHVTLAGQDADYLVWQALGSSETIEYEMGKRPRFVSYPAGDFDELDQGNLPQCRLLGWLHDSPGRNAQQ